MHHYQSMLKVQRTPIEFTEACDGVSVNYQPSPPGRSNKLYFYHFSSVLIVFIVSGMVKEDKKKLEPNVVTGCVVGSTPMVWYMAFYGMAWYGMVWYGMV